MFNQSFERLNRSGPVTVRVLEKSDYLLSITLPVLAHWRLSILLRCYRQFSALEDGLNIWDGGP